MTVIPSSAMFFSSSPPTLELLNKSFGSDSNYRKLSITNKSGDHIIELKGMKFMFENKKYTEMVPKIEVEKGFRIKQRL